MKKNKINLKRFNLVHRNGLGDTVEYILIGAIVACMGGLAIFVTYCLVTGV